MTLQTDSGNVVVVLTENTQVEEVEGTFHACKKQLAMTALVPDLACQVQRSYNRQNQLVADTVKFQGSNLQAATEIQAEVAGEQQETQAQSARDQAAANLDSETTGSG